MSSSFVIRLPRRPLAKNFGVAKRRRVLRLLTSHQSRLIFYSQTDYDYEHEHEHEFFIRHPLATPPARETFGVASAKEDHLSAFPSPSSFPQP